MFAKRSQLIKNIHSTLKANGFEISESAADNVLKVVEIFMEPKLRPLTKQEVEDHVLVKQVHESRKDEVREYVKNLDYEMKREWIPEDV